jgi:hypothetical protein
MDNPNHRIYLLTTTFKSTTHLLGFIRMGSKHLIAMGETGGHFHISPLCVLDFYVSESYQRYGHGREIFEFMLNSERDILEGPHKLAYDRPSPKLQGFLKKHYQLYHSIPQSNNFLIFKEFGLSSPPQTPKERRSYGSRRNVGVRLEPIMPFKLSPLSAGPVLDVPIKDEIQDVPLAVENYSTIPAIITRNSSEEVDHQHQPLNIPLIDSESVQSSQGELNACEREEEHIAPSLSYLNHIDHCESQQNTHGSMVNLIQKSATNIYPPTPPKQARYSRNTSLPALGFLPSIINDEKLQSNDPVNPFLSGEAQYRQFADHRRKSYTKQTVERRSKFQNQHESSLFQPQSGPYSISAKTRGRSNAHYDRRYKLSPSI